MIRIAERMITKDISRSLCVMPEDPSDPMGFFTVGMRQGSKVQDGMDHCISYADMDEYILTLLCVRNAKERGISLDNGLWARSHDGKIVQYGAIIKDFGDGHATYMILARPLDQANSGIFDILYVDKDTLEEFPAPKKIKPTALVQAFIDVCRAGQPVTWDGFFNKQEVPLSDRNDFAIAAIYRQAKIHAPELFSKEG